jgi:hypothetical protein
MLSIVLMVINQTPPNYAPPDVTVSPVYLVHESMIHDRITVSFDIYCHDPNGAIVQTWIEDINSQKMYLIFFCVPRGRTPCGMTDVPIPHSNLQRSFNTAVTNMSDGDQVMVSRVIYHP